MKKNYLLLLSFILIYNILSAATFSSNVASGPWSAAASWSVVGVDADGIPDNDDDVTILVGHLINDNIVSSCRNFTIQGTFKGAGSMVLTVYGNYVVTGSETGTGAMVFSVGAAPGLTISGAGVFSNAIRYTFNNLSNRTISAGTTIVKDLATGITNTSVTNLGNVTLSLVNTFTGANWINGTNSSLTLKTAGFLSAAGTTFNASATGNIVKLQYTGGAVPITISGYYDLQLTATAANTKTLAANTVVLRNITMNTNNNLNSNNFDLTVGGNWLNNGVFTASAGKTVTFNGTVAQTVSNTIGTTTFKRLTVNNPVGISLTTGIYLLDEVLTVSNGTFNTSGRPFTMTSTATQTARIAPLLGMAAIAGNFTVQRFITARDTTFADLASPIQNSTFLDWDNELPGISYVYNPPSQQASGNTYNEATDVYVPITSSGTTLTPGQGFEVFLAGNFTYGPFPAVTMTTFGIPNQGDQDVTGLISNAAQGWNLVGNPFASSISWASIYANAGTSGLYDFFEMYDYTIQDWNGFTSGSGVEIGSSQGFWVYGLPGNGAVTMNIPETAKTTASNSSIKAQSVRQPYFTLKISNTTNAFAHIFKVTANETAFDGLDVQDLPFRASPNATTPALYSMVDGKKININNFNVANENYSMPLTTTTTIAGNYKIEADGFDFISDYTCIKLEDKLLNKLIDLTAERMYSFSMNPTDNADRFIVHFSKNNTCKSFVANNSTTSNFNNEVTILPTAQGNVIQFNASEITPTIISVVNVLGQTLVDAISVDASTQSVNITLPEGFSGMYLVKVTSAKGAITKKFVKK
jgi:Secretion system C-terminal sorting domain